MAERVQLIRLIQQRIDVGIGEPFVLRRSPQLGRRIPDLLSLRFQVVDTVEPRLKIIALCGPVVHALANRRSRFAGVDMLQSLIAGTHRLDAGWQRVLGRYTPLGFRLNARRIA